MPLTNRTLILFKYFWETTDEVHPVSIADISAHLKEQRSHIHSRHVLHTGTNRNLM